MSVSQLAKSIAESPTLRLNEQARLLREKGEAVIHLGVGEPKNRAPIAAILSAASKLNTGDVKYTPADGTPSLEEAIIRYTEENYDRVVAPENVIVSAGAKQSVFNILYSVLNPQEEVIILAPYWVSYPEMVRMCYGVPVIVKAEDGGFVPRMEDIEKAVGSQTRVIICNSPNNPSGVLYPAEPDRRARRVLRAQGDLARHGRHLPQAPLRREEVAQLLQVHEQGHRDDEGHRRQRRLEALRHDRLPDRVGDRAAVARPDHDERPGADHDDASPSSSSPPPKARCRPPERRREPEDDAREQPERHAPGALRRSTA